MSNPDSSSQCLFWFRRDLRLDDNHGLFRALKLGPPVVPIFIFDPNILDGLPRQDRRVEFILLQLKDLHETLGARFGSALRVEVGSPVEVFERLFNSLKVKYLVFNEDYEPYACDRDRAVSEMASRYGVHVQSFKDQVIFAKDEVVKEGGSPYLVYTPYSKRWLSLLKPEHLTSYPSLERGSGFVRDRLIAGPPGLKELGFSGTGTEFPGLELSDSVLKGYARKRDLMAEQGTSRLGLHLRFGTVSIRKLIHQARALSPVYLKELIWREFFMQMLFHFPNTVDRPFDARYDGFPWRNNKDEFNAWCEGRTGYPLVDAGLRELNATGYMHNRARMVAASFLTKHLLIDWRWGERYFAEKLLDFELASNVGNWQWAAGCGCDAAPYFRVFNPALQAKKFDPEGKYVRSWVPELGTERYPKPMVDHEYARRRALMIFDQHLKRGRHESPAHGSHRAHR